MTKRMVIMLILVGVLFGGIFGFQAFKAHMIKKFMAGQGLPPQTVSTIQATRESWQPQLEAVGTLKAVHGVDLAPEVSGTVAEIHFHSGDEVKEGALLLALDARSDIAKLQSLKAAAQLTEQIFLRDQQQFKEKTISQATLDADTANLKSARAQVAEQQALIDKKLSAPPFPGASASAPSTSASISTPAPSSSRCRRSTRSSSILPAAKIGQPGQGRGQGHGDDRRLSRQGLPRRDRRHRPQGRSEGTRNVEVRARVHNPGTCCCPGCSSPPRSRPAPRSATSPCRRRPSPSTPTATRSSWSRSRARGRTASRLVGTAEVRDHRRDPGRPDRHPRRREARREVVTAGQTQAAQRRAGGHQQHHPAVQQPGADAQGRVDGSPSMKFTDIFIRRPGAGDRGEPLHAGARPALGRAAAGAAVPAHPERRGHRHHRLHRRRCRRWWRASSPRRWRTPSPRPTASTT